MNRIPGAAMRRVVSAMVFAVLALGVFVVGAVNAHTGATGVVRERMDAMSSMSDFSKALNAMIKGRTSLDADTVKRAAGAYADEAARMLDRFPDTDDSRSGNATEALPEIWDDWPAFVDEAAKFQAAADRFLQTVDASADTVDWQDAFSEVRQSCRSCHKRFRKKKR